MFGRANVIPLIALVKLKKKKKKRCWGTGNLVSGAQGCILEPVQEKKSGAPLCADIV